MFSRSRVLQRAGLLLVLVISIGAAPAQGVTPPEPEIRLVVLEEEGVVGDRMLWHLTLSPRDAATIEALSIQSSDLNLWRQEPSVTVPEVLTLPETLVVPMVPLDTGSFTPAVRVSYRVEGVEGERLIQAEAPVEIHPVSDYVDTALLSEHNAVRVGGPLTLTLWVRNRTPFTLADIRFVPLASGVRWEALSDPLILRPQEVAQVPLVTTVETRNPEFHGQLSYTWRDDVANSRMETMRIEGPGLTAEPSLFAQIPVELLAIFLGILASVLTTAGTRIVEAYVERRMQRDVNERRVLGLLKLALTKAAYAVHQSEPFDLELLETLLKEEPLYTLLEERNLAADIQRFWQAGELHNRNLTRPEGRREAANLDATIRNLRAKIRRLERGTGLYSW